MGRALLAIVQSGVLLLASLIAPPLPAQPYPPSYPPSAEGPFFDAGTGHWYLRVSELSGYHEGRFIAESMGGYVVAINDANEQSFLQTQFPSFPPGLGYDTYIGLTNEQNPPAFAWDSGEPLTFTDWGPNQPPTTTSPRFARGLADWWPVADIEPRALIECETPVLATPLSLTCAATPPDAILSWNAAGFDTVRIYRGETLIATVPAASGGYVDAGTYGGRYTLLAETSAGVSLPARCGLAVPDPGYTIRLPAASAIHPGPTDVSVLLDHTVGDVQGFSLGICFDTDLVDIMGVIEGAAIFAISPTGADFSNWSVDSGAGLTLSQVFDFIPPYATLPPGIDQELAVITMIAAAAGPLSIPLRICAEVGVPPVAVVLVVGGTPIVPLAVDGSVAFTTGAFRRGDGNDDGAVDLADVLFLGLLLFGTPAGAFPCREACEVNGDAQVDIADMVHTLSYLFIGGTPPGAPFPDCGPDPDPGTGLGCDLGLSCP